MGLEPGDVVVVDAKDRPAVAWVVKVHEAPEIDVKEPYEYKWVICHVDTAAWLEQKAKEAEAVKMLQIGERQRAQQEALDALMATVPNREELLKLLGG